MAPSRKSRSVNKRFSNINEVASSKDGENANKRQRVSPGFAQKKRKLSDMLGPQWSKEELERFYAAYRKHGKDWKRVAAVVRNRSVDMVEALYTMNKAYLSLPEGTASVVGLIAMMTDHYSVLEGSDSEEESNGDAGASRKPQKRARGKIQNNTSKELVGHFPDLSRSQSFASSYGCLSLLKKRRSGIKPHAVKKRTPRVPVSYDRDNGEKYFSPARQSSKQRVDAKDDDVAHEIALVLTEASQRGGSPQLSQTPNRKTKGAMRSSVQNCEKMHAEAEMSSAKLRVSEVDEDGCELSLGSTEADNGDYARDKRNSRGREGAGTVEGQQKGKRYNAKKPEVEESINDDLDDIKEACSGTEEGQKPVAVKGKLESEVVARSSFKGLRKRSKKVLFGEDEGSAFDALQTLADLSLMMPDTELSALDKEESLDMIDNSKVKGNHFIPGVKVSSLRTAKLDKGFAHNIGAIPETKEETHQSNTGMRKRKQKILPFKNVENEARSDSHMSESKKIEAIAEVKVSLSKGKRSSHNATQPKPGKMVKPTEHTSSSTDLRREGNDSALSTLQVSSADQVKLPTKVRSRRKMDVQKLLIQNDSKSSESIFNEHPKIPIPSPDDRAVSLKEKLSNCLSGYQARRWCTFEWFYSAIDYPWFAKREFVEYLDHVGLGHVPRLTRVEWGVIRSSLGRPRRFSEQFLKEEREKLNQYRESVRRHYAELRAGTREGLPTDLARPLSVGQRVIALHPRTREIHDGSVLTVDHSRCRIQFDRPELGVEFVLDIDCMPLNPVENMPATLIRNVAVNKLFENFNELKIKFSPNENLDNTDGPYNSTSSHQISNLLKQGGSPSSGVPAKVKPSEITNTQQAANSQFSLLAQIQAKEADIQALSALTCSLEKKEAVVSELKRMNEAVFENKKDGDNSLKDSEHFKKQYAAVLLQLNEVNEQVSSALFCLRQRNTYQQSSPLMLLKPTASLGDPGGQLNSFDCSTCHNQESGPHVTEIVESSRTKAQIMVEVAMQAVSCFRKGGVNIEKIEEAIDFVNNQLLVDESSMLARRASTPADSIHVTEASQDHSTACTSSATDHAPDPKSDTLSDRNEAKIPSELIANCIATLFMIQKCTERQFPPADVAQVLDSAVTSLQPCCSQNLPIYAEIQKCMGIIRNQILALIPT
ncbi:protein ALWAYS EARLY 3 isoform X2 [Corylus avellana]|uniref:protein ALWAYS EARLY 3 isoform X2 n=1 Tax=Corylus avellana TaxID=13451 RepID=UPI00286A0C5B|nr:protein ALWAYS EARLY 3 isoform X2 [Corylus avellana]